MATRSAICYIQKNKKVIGIYCHWDGYPDHHLPILKNKYNEKDTVKKLVSLGDLSTLEWDKDWSGQGKEVGPLTYKSRGDSWADIKPRKFNSLDEAKKYFKDIWCEYLYLFSDNQEWLDYCLYGSENN